MNSQSIPSPDINHLAKLANIPLSDDNKKAFEKQLSAVVAYVGEVTKINLDGVEETAQVTGKVNELREDVVTPSMSQAEALSQAHGHIHEGYFVVPQVIKHD
jgi:aspartyl-tRNA(Asn)/glutamyl-tRNA(Gln) amidotransferase subunit C